MSLRRRPRSLHAGVVELLGRHVPRHTIRFRLTLLYGGLFLLSGAGLLAATYFLVTRATTQTQVKHLANGGGTSAAVRGGSSAAHAAAGRLQIVTAHGTGPLSSSSHGAALTPAQLRQQARKLFEQAVAQHAHYMHQFALYAGLALAFMAVVAVVLGWFVAGRALRPLRTMTATVREISASNLDERLGLDGPGDELRELADTFDELLGRLERSFRAQRQFVANASHELRTPLARQKVLSQLALADEAATLESLRRAHERVLACEEQQERLIDALLALSRGQAGTASREAVDLGSVAEQAVLAREGEAAIRHVDVACHAGTASLIGDARLVERLVTNLVDNAIRHNVDGGSVTVGTRTVGDRVVVSVANTGPEVSGPDLERILEPFERLEGHRTTGATGGLGLGLSIVKAVADAHAALLTIQPHPEGGLDVEVAFPAAGDVEPPDGCGVGEGAAGRALAVAGS